MDEKKYEELKKEAELQIAKDVNRQIRWISMNGCTNIRCKNCYLRQHCDHVPSHSKEFAFNLIKSVRERGEKN